jgi:hypothetical protein
LLRLACLEESKSYEEAFLILKGKLLLILTRNTMTSNNEMVCSLLPSGDSDAVKQVEALSMKLDALNLTREAEVTASNTFLN